MNIASKLTLGLVSVVFLGTAAFSATAFAQQQSVTDLRAQLDALLAQLAALEGGSKATTTAAVSGGNKACPYTWARNLTIGSTGKDVYQLQMFLNEVSRLNNNNPKTLVAQSGAGSPGNESSYYGPATARAVSGFQEMYAAQILTPLGLSKGTGGFYTSTRNQANNICAAGSSSTTSVGVPVVSVSGGSLAVTSGKQPADSYAVRGAQRVPFTSFVLTAGSKDVRLSGITVRRFGLSDSDNFASVALVDPNGVQIGSARSLNRNNEAKLGGNLVIPRNRSVTLAVVGNIASDEDDVDGGAVAGLEIVSVTADATIQGQFPIRGAAHVFSEGVDLQTVEVTVSGGDDIEFNEDTEVASVKIKLDAGSADAEDAYLRSLTLEQTGSADEDEIGKVDVFVDGDRGDYDLTLDGDRYVITFEGKGVLIEEDESVDITLEVNTDMGSGETVQFKLDDPADVYVVGRDYGYGLPICVKGDTDCNGREDTGEEHEDMTRSNPIGTGTISRGGRIREFDDEVSYGDDVVLGALSVEFEGEDIDMEDLTFNAVLSGHKTTMWDDAEVEEVFIENIQLRVDGEVVAYGDDDAEFKQTAFSANQDAEKSIAFNDRFTIDVRRDREVIFEIVADLNDDWADFDGAELQFTLTDVGTAEGINSEKNYAFPGDPDASPNPLPAAFFGVDRKFEEVSLIGNDIDFSITDYNVDETDYVAGAADIVFGTLEVDASDAVDDIELTDMEISFQTAVAKPDSGTATTGDLSRIENCRVMDGDDEVADMRGSLSGAAKSIAHDAAPTEARVKDQARFRFDDFTVRKNTDATLDIVCDIDDRANSGKMFVLKADVDATDKIEYTVGRDDREFNFEADDASDEITISERGTIDVSVDNPDEDNTSFAVATGSTGERGIEVLEVDIEAKQEAAVISDIYLANVGLGAGGVTIDRDKLEEVISSIEFSFGGSTERANHRDLTTSGNDLTFGAADYDNIASDVVATNHIHFENVNHKVEVDTEESFTMEIDFSGINDRKGSAGQFLTAAKLIILWEGEDSGTDNNGNLDEVDLGSAFSTAVAYPTILSVSTREGNTNLSTGKEKLYEFSVTADDKGDAYLKQVGLKVTPSSGVTVTDLELHRGTSKGTSIGGKTGSIAAGDHKVAFTKAREIKAGETKTFSVYGTIGGTIGDNSSIDTVILTDAKGTPVLGDSVADLSSANMIWSPNGEDGDGDEAVDDWFNGWPIVSDADAKEWTLD